MTITATDVKSLRERTGAGMMECKKALEEAKGNMDQAVDLLRKRGLAAAAKKASRIASEGMVHAYIHPGGRLGVLLEVNCETDFVAKNTDFQSMVRDISMQIAATNPKWIRREEVPAATVEHEMVIYRDQALASNKPAQVVEKIALGKLEKFYSESCLLEQPFVKDDKLKVADLVQNQVAKLGENLSVRRFVRFEVGEGLEKRQDDFVSEVMKQAAS
ncbi:MAG: translation elongation factor Ts [Candidatus Wallbacteria bacterium]|nr:translation elongation factor Ts [Candidatus Wallbacteria bacterium]